MYARHARLDRNLTKVSAILTVWHMTSLLLSNFDPLLLRSFCLSLANCKVDRAGLDPAMTTFCGYGRYVIPASTLLSRKLNRTAAWTTCAGRGRSDQKPGPCRKRHFCVLSATNTVEQPVQAEKSPVALQQNKSAFRAFLDFKALKADLDKHVQNCKNRNSNADPERVATLYDQYCEAQQRVDKAREDRNSNAKAMKVVYVCSARLCCR